MNRDQALARLEDRRGPWDMVVIGGGATGAGIALDAAARGYDVVLLERDDFAAGTSSRSTKLIHGGVRYLRQGRIGVVRHALEERSRLLRNAPHRVDVRSFFIPVRSRFEKLFYGLGLALYDRFSRDASFPRSRASDASESVRLVPGLDSSGTRGGIVYSDGVFDDSGLVIDLLHSATLAGAVVLNYSEAVRLVRDGSGRVRAVVMQDRETMAEHEIAARVVVNAGGPFVDEVRRLARPDVEPLLAPSRGVHIVLDRDFWPGDVALLVPKTDDGRVVFCVPWKNRVIVGTTDTAVPGPSRTPSASREEIEWLLSTIGGYLRRKPDRSDVKSVFAGLRPLPRGRSMRATGSVSRDHLLEVSDEGLVTMTSGKWTTYRLMAEIAVDAAARTGGLEPRACPTAERPILAATPRDLDDAATIVPTPDFIDHAVDHLMARRLEDVLARRSRALFLDAAAAIAAAPQVARRMAARLGKDEAWVENEVQQIVAMRHDWLALD